MRDFLNFIIPPVIGITLLMTILLIPIMYFDGCAKSEYLRQAEGVSLPWYRACWLDVQINSAYGRFEIK